MERAQIREGLRGSPQLHIRARLALSQTRREKSHYKKRNVKKSDGLERLRAAGVEQVVGLAEASKGCQRANGKRERATDGRDYGISRAQK